jgi:hypothetical protein
MEKTQPENHLPDARKSRAGSRSDFKNSEALGDFNLKATAGLPPEKQKAEFMTDMFLFMFICTYLYIYIHVHVYIYNVFCFKQTPESLVILVDV